MPDLTGHKAESDHTVQFFKLNLDLSGDSNAHELILSLEVNDELALEGNHQISQELKGFGMQLSNPEYLWWVACQLKVLDDDFGDGLVLVLVEQNVQLLDERLLEELAVLPLAIGREEEAIDDFGVLLRKVLTSVDVIDM